MPAEGVVLNKSLYLLPILLLFSVLALASEKTEPQNDDMTSGNSRETIFWLDCNYPELTTEHHIPFDLTCQIESQGEDPVTGFGAVDENGDPLGVCTMEGDQLHWQFDPPCEWVDDGIAHTINLYVESIPAGIIYPNVVLETIPLIVTNSPPGATEHLGVYAIPLGYSGTIEIDIYDPNEENSELIWSYSVLPCLPDGDVELIDGLLYFRPCVTDDGIDFGFTVRAMDCAGEYAECDETIMVPSCRAERCLGADPNLDGDINILDVIFLINYIYKEGPAPLEFQYADWNWDAKIDILDVVYMINFLYKDGPFAQHGPVECNK